MVFCLGIPSLSVAPIDPLEISRLHIGQGNGPVAIELTFNNLKIYGFHGVQILDPKAIQ